MCTYLTLLPLSHLSPHFFSLFSSLLFFFFFFFFNDPAPPEIYPLSLHDALPISGPSGRRSTLSKWSVIHRYWAEESCGIFRNAADRKSTRLNSSHLGISYAVFCLKKKKKNKKKKKRKKKKQKQNKKHKL